MDRSGSGLASLDLRCTNSYCVSQMTTRKQTGNPNVKPPSDAEKSVTLRVLGARVLTLPIPKRIGNPNLKPLAANEKSVTVRVRGDRGTLVFFERLTAEERGRVLELAFGTATGSAQDRANELDALRLLAVDRQIAAMAGQLAVGNPS